ncbi:MAG: lipocalin family protein [Bacteroidales bacterium]|nr:lipocalin family protein [Bacteroidales bacterium]
MKKIFLLFAATLAIVTMTACKKDYEELIVGKWQIANEESYPHDIIFNHYIPEPIENMDSWGFVFHANGSGLSYEIVGGAEVERSQLTYTLDGDDIYIMYTNGVRIRWTIEKIGDKRLKLSSRYELNASNGDRRYGYGYWNFERKEYVAPVFPTDTIVPTDTIPGTDTLTTKKLFL